MADDPRGFIPELPRFSGLDYCIRSQVARLMGFDLAPPPAYMQPYLDEGNEWEELIIAQLRADGWELIGQQMELEIAGVAVGHPDGIGRPLPVVPYHIVEIKKLGKNYMESFRKAEAHPDGFGAGLRAHLPRYAWQVSMLMCATHLPAYFIVADKWLTLDQRSSKEAGRTLSETDEIVLHVKEIDVPPVSLEEITARCHEVIRLAAAGELPECDRQDGGMCGARNLGGAGCAPKVKEGPAYPELAPAVDPEDEKLELALAQLKAARALSADAKKREDAAKTEVLELLAGRKDAAAGRLRVKVTVSPAGGLDSKAVREFIRAHHKGNADAVLADLKSESTRTTITITEA